jgi:septal ring factor EnvC (AmiA/AmiB activator)
MLRFTPADRQHASYLFRTPRTLITGQAEPFDSASSRATPPGAAAKSAMEPGFGAKVTPRPHPYDEQRQHERDRQHAVECSRLSIDLDRNLEEQETIRWKLAHQRELIARVYGALRPKEMAREKVAARVARLKSVVTVLPPPGRLPGWDPPARRKPGKGPPPDAGPFADPIIGREDEKRAIERDLDAAERELAALDQEIAQLKGSLGEVKAENDRLYDYLVSLAGEEHRIQAARSAAGCKSQPRQGGDSVVRRAGYDPAIPAARLRPSVSNASSISRDSAPSGLPMRRSLRTQAYASTSSRGRKRPA